MIYTLTLNPSIDYIMHIDNFIDGKTIRSINEAKYPGGKGIMVSKLLKNLGDNPTNLGFIGGYTGDFIVDALNGLEINEEFTKISGDTRINIKLKYNHETEINAGGPDISEDEKNAFLDQVKGLDKNSTLIISGSVPRSLGQNFYKEILELNDFDFTIDVAGKELLTYLAYKPLLVKPNIDELSEIFDAEISRDNVVKYARRLYDLGAQNVIVSMGGDGSVFVNGECTLLAKPISGELINSVGAGDSMVGGFIHGIKIAKSSKEAYKLAVASGTATAFSEDIASKEKIEEILNKVEVIDYGN